LKVDATAGNTFTTVLCNAWWLEAEMYEPDCVRDIRRMPGGIRLALTVFARQLAILTVNWRRQRPS
jgi:hypothetical protein